VKVVPVPVASPSHRNSHDRAIIILGAIAVIAIATLLRLGLRRPRRR
jgi:ABC-type Co2+ transport system permease subunit